MQTFTPSTSAYRSFVTGAVPGLVIVLALLSIQNYDRLWFDILAPTVLLLAVGYGLFFFKHTKVQSGPHELVITGITGRRSYGADRLGRCVLADRVEQSSGRYGTTTLARLFVLDPTGKRLLLWLSSTWTIEQMTALTTSLALPVDHITERVTAGELRRRYPGAVSLLTARPHAADIGVRLSVPDEARIADRLALVMRVLAQDGLKLRDTVIRPLAGVASVHRSLEAGQVHAKVLLATSDQS